MKLMGQRIIFHIDVNSAFLSWTAAYRVKVLGESLDLRNVPSVVAGDRESRHSIILAKSGPAKKFGIKTGEPLFQAQQKCPTLLVAEPDYGLYVEASRRFVALLREYSPVVEQYSIDEAWVDMTGTQRLYGPPVLAAQAIKDRIREELGFTVNIGISSNKLLAKMAGDFEKPDKVHTLFPEEMEGKFWPLPVRELFLVGRATERKLHQLGIHTIGELAKADPAVLCKRLYKPGKTLWHYANGRCAELVTPIAPDNKGYGNAMTVPFDVGDSETAHQVLLSLCETVGMRMRRDGKAGACVTVRLRTNQFQDSTHQRQLHGATDVTQEIYRAACMAFDEAWDEKTPLRQLGVSVTKITGECYRQYDFLSGFSPEQADRRARIDNAIDGIREKYGEDAILRARFVGSELTAMGGGLSKHRRTGITKPLGEEC